MSAATPASAPLPPLDPNARYTIAEAIRYLRASRATVYKWINSGELKTIETGGRRILDHRKDGKVSGSPLVGKKVASRRWVPASEIIRLCTLPTSDAA